MHEEAATEWKDVALQAIADDPSRMRVFPLLPRHGISLGAFDADEDFGCLWNAMRIAKSFPETWRRTPLSARRRILKRWREGPIPIEAQSLGFLRGTGDSEQRFRRKMNTDSDGKMNTCFGPKMNTASDGKVNTFGKDAGMGVQNGLEWVFRLVRNGNGG